MPTYISVTRSCIQDFQEVVDEEQIIRVLNSFVHAQFPNFTYLQGMSAICGTFLYTMPEVGNAHADIAHRMLCSCWCTKDACIIYGGHEDLTVSCEDKGWGGDRTIVHGCVVFVVC